MDREVTEKEKEGKRMNGEDETREVKRRKRRKRLDNDVKGMERRLKVIRVGRRG